jgi:hypothetical protein
MASRAPKLDILPQWTKRVVTELGGRDPLGLSRVGQMLTDLLLPGITTQTSRARYYALYCWILWHIQDQEKPQRYEEFVRAFQRREAVVALSTLINDDDTSPVGVEAARRRLTESEAAGEINTSFQVLPSNPLGGFGQYYSGSLYALGLTHQPGDGMFRVTDDSGKKLALAIDRTVADTPYIRRKLFADSTVPLKAIKASSERLSIDAIGGSFASDERALLTNLFFGLHEEKPWATTAYRRRSLSQILTVIAAYESSGIEIESASPIKQLLFAPSYFGVLVDDQNHAKPYRTSGWLQRSLELWRQFCLHQFLTQALEGLLQALLDVLAAHPGGVTLREGVASLVDHRFFEYLKNAAGKSGDSPRALLNALGIKGAPDEQSCIQLRARYPYEHPLGEWICEREAETPPEVAGRACLLLAVLYGKWRGVSGDAAYRMVGEKAGLELAAPNVLPLLDSWCDHQSSWSTVLLQLLTLIVQQHDRVMYSKGRLESCWLHQVEDRLVLDQPCEPAFHGSRQEQAVKVLSDLGLLVSRGSKESSTLGITAKGRKVLKQAESESK